MAVVNSCVDCLHVGCASRGLPCRRCDAPPLPLAAHDLPLPTWSHRAGFSYVPPVEGPPRV